MIRLAAARMGVSYRNELLIVGAVLLSLVSLPLLAVVVMADAGVNVVSDALVSVDLHTKTVEIHDPSGLLMSTLPVSSTWPVGGVVTLEFGVSDPPWQLHHTGIDIADPQGKVGRPVTPFMEGVVSKVVNVDNEYGHYLYVDHGNHIVSQYWHLSNVLVKVGDHVKPGDIIGLEGATGRATGPHLHFEIQVYGIPTNPRLFINGPPPSGASSPLSANH